MTHPLDRHVWSALTTRCAGFAGRTEHAAVLDPQIGPFAALDDPTPAAWSGLTDLTTPGAAVALFMDDLDPPDPWRVVRVLPCHQLVLDRSVGPEPDASVRPIGPDDLAEVGELVRLTEPGPYAERTTELGGYVGIRDHGRLVALAGCRMQSEDPGGSGYVEISLVCVHPDHRGRGLARRVVHAVAAAIQQAGDTAYLHVLTDNAAAANLYASMGFAHRTTIDVHVVQRASVRR